MAQSIRHDVSAAELDRHLRAIAREVRLSGSPEEARAFDYIQAQLEAFGYRVTREAQEALIGYPVRSSLEVLDPNRRYLAANGYSMSPATGDEGVVGELLYAGSGNPADYVGLDATGKVVLTDGLATPGKALAAARAGAIGHININDSHVHEMCVSPIWGTPIPETANLLPSVPAVGIVQGDGDWLKAVLSRGPARVRLTTHPYLAWCTIPTLTGDLDGVLDDHFVLFSGHVDSWHYGAMDNGTANATQLEVARLLSERRAELRRGVRLAFWSGHSHGRYAGSTWYADTHWQDLHERCVCHINIDSVGVVGASVLDDAPTMAETYAFGRALLRELAGIELAYHRISRSSDQSFWGHGVPTLWATLSEQQGDQSPTSAAMGQLLGGGGLGWWWHTTEDTLDKIDPANLLRDARIYAETLWRLGTLERLPFDYAAAADESAEALSRAQAAAGGKLDLSGPIALARRLGETIRACPWDRLDAERANALTMGLGHTLIPINYTRSGPFEHDLALGSQALPGLADAPQLARLDPASDDFHFLRARLMRERNRIEHGLRAASRLVEAAGAGDHS